MKNLSDFLQIIRTARLVLKIVVPNQANAEMFLKTIEQNRKYLEVWQGHFEYLYDIEDVRKKLEHRYMQISNNEGILFGIYQKEKLIGRIRFFDVHNNFCEIGYWLIESANGYGYMSEALSALERELFIFGFDKIILKIHNGNTHSEKLAIRNGYNLEKRLIQASESKSTGKCDLLVYAKYKKCI